MSPPSPSHPARSTSPAPVRARSSQDHGEPPIRPRLVLLVVPDAPLRGFLQRLCEKHGHTTLVARSADEGLQLLSQVPTRPDVAVLDATLTADTVAGRASVERFASLAPLVPLVVIGGRMRDVDIPRLTVHPSLWLPAPFDGEGLLTALETAAETPSLRRTDRAVRLA